MKNKTKLDLSSLFIILVGLLLCASVTLAWFSKNREVEAQGLNIIIATPGGVELGSYHVYKMNGTTGLAEAIFCRYANDTGEFVTKSLDEDNQLVESSQTDFTFQMTEYDQIFTDRNVNTPLVLRVELSSLVTDSTTGLYPLIKCRIGTSKGNASSNNKLLNDLTNIIKINCAAISSIDAYDTVFEANSIFTETISTFKNTTDYPKQSFVSVSTSIVNKTLTYNFDKESNLYFEIDPNDFTVSDGKLIVYFEIDYDPDLIEAYFASNGISIGNYDDGTTAEEISFPNDISVIEFEYIK